MLNAAGYKLTSANVPRHVGQLGHADIERTDGQSITAADRRRIAEIAAAWVAQQNATR